MRIQPHTQRAGGLYILLGLVQFDARVRITISILTSVTEERQEEASSYDRDAVCSVVVVSVCSMSTDLELAVVASVFAIQLALGYLSSV